jgi:GTPase involved in cell partitioning and DNA repair
MKTLLLIIITIFLIGCDSKKEAKSEIQSIKKYKAIFTDEVPEKKPDVSVTDKILKTDIISDAKMDKLKETCKDSYKTAKEKTEELTIEATEKSQDVLKKGASSMAESWTEADEKVKAKHKKEQEIQLNRDAEEAKEAK